MSKKPRFGLALGGGGSRAFFHYGILTRLEEEGLRPDVVSGSSMGAVLGALYAAKPGIATIKDALDYFRKSSLFGSLSKQEKGDGLNKGRNWISVLLRKAATASVATAISFRKGLRTRHPANKAIDAFFPWPGPDIASLALPFGLNALDLTNGKVRDFTSGQLNPSLKAGVAIGLIFSPYHWQGITYADAAPLCPVPVGLCRQLGADVVLAVDICAPLDKEVYLDSGFDIVRRIMSIQSETLNNAETSQADIVVKCDVSDVFWADFSKIDELVERGKTAAEEILDQVRERIQGASKNSHFVRS